MVIGNPPYIFARNKSFTSQDKNYFTQNYKVAEYQVNTYHLFIELAWKLLKKNGTFAYIVPNNILTIQSNLGIRKFLVENTGNLVLINSLDKIFEDASVDNAIIFFNKSNPTTIEVAELIDEEIITLRKVNNDFFGDSPVFSFSKVKYNEYVSLYNKMESCKRLGNLADVKSGIKAYETGKGNPPIDSAMKSDRVYHSYVREDDQYRPYIQGKDVDRYNLKWSGEWIKYGENLAAMREPFYFEEPRILVRQIPRKSTYSLPATYYDKNLINDMNSMIIRNFSKNPFFLLGIINSKIETIWFIIKFDKFQRGTYPQFKISELKQFPIPYVTKNQEEHMKNLVKRRIELANKMEVTKEILVTKDNEIDEFVMELFGLNDHEKELVRNFELEN